jgi:hypothetical protein
MAALKMVRTHGVETLDDAKIKMKDLVDEMAPTLERFVESISWNDAGTEARVKGKHVKGTLAVDNTNVKVDLKLSMTAGLFKGVIESKIDSAIQSHFAPEK